VTRTDFGKSVTNPSGDAITLDNLAGQSEAFTCSREVGAFKTLHFRDGARIAISLGCFSDSVTNYTRSWRWDSDCLEPPAADHLPWGLEAA
jgi:hypothetical protein